MGLLISLDIPISRNNLRPPGKCSRGFPNAVAWGAHRFQIAERRSRPQEGIAFCSVFFVKQHAINCCVKTKITILQGNPLYPTFKYNLPTFGYIYI